MPASDSSQTHVRRMLDVIHQHYADRLSLETFARSLGRQPAYLGRLFRQETGATVHDYVTRLRVEQGASQVRSGEKIEAVALCIGYRSKKNFYRQFRRYYGCTPEQYRRAGHAGDAAHTQPIAAPETSASPKLPAANVEAAAPAIDDARAARAATSDRKSEERDSGGIGRAEYQRLKLTLLAQELVLKTLVESPIAMLLTDRSGRYIGANRAALAMTGYSLSDLKQMQADRLLTTNRPLDRSEQVQILLEPSRLFAPNALLRTKNADIVGIHCISSRNPMAESH